MSLKDFPSWYKGRKRTIYQQAVDSLEVKALTRIDSHLRTFVKAEKINFSSKVDPAPRVIQPRNPRYNAVVGCYLRPLEHRLYQAVDSIFHETTIFKGLNAVMVARKLKNKWDKFTKPVAIGLDASRFDQHVSRQALEWEHSVYLGCFGSKYQAELKKLLGWQINNIGVAHCRDGKAKYSVDGCRMSGDMNTALGNCLIMCALVHAFMKHISVEKFSLANNGDDCVLIVEFGYHHKVMGELSDWFLDMGFHMKVEQPVCRFEQIEFCQTHPVRTINRYVEAQDRFEEDYIMVRNAPVALAKDCISLKPVQTEKAFKKYLTSVGECGMALCGRVPIYQEFYQSMIRSGQGHRYKKDDPLLQGQGLYYWSQGLDRHHGTIPAYVRESFHAAFDITPDQQVLLEKYYQSTDILYAPEGKNTQPSLLPRWF